MADIDYLPPIAKSPVRSGGKTLIAPRFFLIFDKDELLHPLEWDIYNCLNALITSDFADGLNVYGSGRGEYAGYVETVFSSNPPDALLKTLLEWRTVPRLSDCIYMFFGGRGWTLPGYGTEWCAYHSALDESTYYAVHPFPQADGCTMFGRLTPLQALTMVASHELAESMTDPVPGSGITDTRGGEIDDYSPCLWSPVRFSVDSGQYGIREYLVQGYEELDGTCWHPKMAAIPVPPAPVE